MPVILPITNLIPATYNPGNADQNANCGIDSAMPCFLRINLQTMKPMIKYAAKRLKKTIKKMAPPEMPPTGHPSGCWMDKRTVGTDEANLEIIGFEPQSRSMLRTDCTCDGKSSPFEKTIFNPPSGFSAMTGLLSLLSQRARLSNYNVVINIKIMFNEVGEWKDDVMVGEFGVVARVDG